MFSIYSKCTCNVQVCAYNVGLMFFTFMRAVADTICILSTVCTTGKVLKDIYKNMYYEGDNIL